MPLREMTLSEFEQNINGLAERIAAKKNWMPSVCKGAVKTFIGCLKKHSVVVDQNGRFSLSHEQLSDLYDELFRNKNYNSLLKAQFVNELLFLLRLEKQYMGSYLNVPQQVPRELILDLTTIPFALFGNVDLIQQTLNNPKEYTGSTFLEDIEANHLCAFIASALLDGVLTENFIRRLVHIRFEDITFSPFTVKIHHSERNNGSDEQLSYFRYWLSPISEAYFQKLLLFLFKNRRKSTLRFESEYAFPISYRADEKLKKIDTAFKKWTKTHGGKAISIKNFRAISLYKLFSSVPCFVSSALSNDMRCDSLDSSSLALIETGLKKVRNISCPKIKVKGLRKENKKYTDKEEISKILSRNKKLLSESKTYAEVIGKIHKIRLGIPRTAKEAERKAARVSIDAVIEKIDYEDIKPEEGFLNNLRFYGLWLTIQLSNHKLKIKSINTEASGIEKNFIAMMGSASIASMSTEELKEVIRRTFVFYGSDNIRKSIKSFTNALYDYQEDLFPQMAWTILPWGTDRRLWKENVKRTKPLIGFSQMRGALRNAQNSTRFEPKKLRVAIILAFFAGLRISEILHLNIDSLVYDEGYVLRIRTSKTLSGVRNVPLSLLLPNEYLDEAVSLFERDDKVTYRNKLDTEPTLLFAEKDPFKESISYSNEVAALFKAINPNIRFHHLRHSFANWLLIRWYVLIFGKNGISEEAEFLEEELFNKKYLDYLKTIISGYGGCKIGQDFFSHVLPVLARIIGHAGPATTMASYIHIFDWLYYLFIPKNEGQLILKAKSAIVEDFMQLSYRKLPLSLVKRKDKLVSLELLLFEQHARLKKKVEGGFIL